MHRITCPGHRIITQADVYVGRIPLALYLYVHMDVRGHMAH
jgi:hypothetical protein